MPKNRPQRTAKGLALYVLEHLEQSPHKENGFNETHSQLKNLWPKLTKEIRDEYNAKAENCSTLDEDIKKKIEEDEQNQARMRKLAEQEAEELHSMIEDIFLDPDWKKRELFAMSVIRFCKTEKEIFPGELAIVKFSIEKGVGETLLMVRRTSLRTMKRVREYLIVIQRIDPGALPSGSSNEATLVSNETHKMPVPPKAEGERDMQSVRSKVEEFIGTNMIVLVGPGPKGDEPDDVRKTLKKLWKGNFVATPKVAPMELFMALSNKSSSLNDCQTSLKSLLQKQPIKPDESCDFHNEQDALAFCSLARSVHWALEAITFMKMQITTVPLPVVQEPVALNSITASTTNPFITSITNPFVTGLKDAQPIVQHIFSHHHQEPESAGYAAFDFDSIAKLEL